MCRSFAPAATLWAPVLRALTSLTAFSRSSSRAGARLESASACFWKAARWVLSFFRSPFWLVTRVFTSAAILATSTAVSLARSSGGQTLASGSSASSHWVRWISVRSSAAFLDSAAAVGALFTSTSRLFRTACEVSATSRAVSPMDFPLSLKKGRASPAILLTLSASAWVPCGHLA